MWMWGFLHSSLPTCWPYENLKDPENRFSGLDPLRFEKEHGFRRWP
jgi:hypothetical protein